MRLKLSDVAVHSAPLSTGVNAHVGRAVRFKKPHSAEHVGRLRGKRAVVVRMNFTVRAGYSSPSDILSSYGNNGAFRSSPGGTEFASRGEGTFGIVEEKATIKVNKMTQDDVECFLCGHGRS